MKLGEILIQEGHLTQEGLEEALDWQVLYGGRLGTNLLELKLVDEEHLARGLGRELGVEVAWGPIELAPEVVELVPKHVADRNEFVPWKFEKRRIKVLCTEPTRLDLADELQKRSGKLVQIVVAPEFRMFQLLRKHYGATRQMRALDFGVIPVEREQMRRKREKEQRGHVEEAPELIDEGAFQAIYAQVLEGRAAASSTTASAAAPPPPPPVLTDKPKLPKLDTVQQAVEQLPDTAILGEADLAEAEVIESGPIVVPAPPAASMSWDEPEPTTEPVEDPPLEFKDAVAALEGVTDRDSVAHIVLRAARSKAARALIMTVQGDVALGWDALGDGLNGGQARTVAVPLATPSAFQLVVKSRSHFMGPLQKTPSNIRFLAQMGRKVPLSSLLLPILHRGRVSHLLYLDNGHKKHAPSDVGEMLILSQRIAQTVEALVQRKRQAARR